MARLPNFSEQSWAGKLGRKVGQWVKVGQPRRSLWSGTSEYECKNGFGLSGMSNRSSAADELKEAKRVLALWDSWSAFERDTNPKDVGSIAQAKHWFV